ncbi:MAG: molybdenum ABC transporter ATP-binding protein [Pseudooceanicola sp.]
MKGLSVDITHDFGGFTLDCAFEAPVGVTALFGHSGAGKTTLVNAVAGLLRPDRARITLGQQVLCDTGAGTWLPPHRRRIGYVFQEGRLLPHLSVAGNLDYPARVAGRHVAGGERDRVIGLLGLAPLLDRRPHALSGGEKQRVAIGRALLSSPEMLLMDEPLAALDAPRRAEILPFLEALRDESALPILYVSHAVEEVARLATTMVLLAEGRVLRAGPAETLFADPELAPAFGLREAGALLTGTVEAHHADGLSEISVAGGRLFLPRVDAAPGARLRVRIEAQDVILSRDRPEGLSALNILPATVAALKDGAGPGVIVQLDAGGEMILARLTRRSAESLALEPGAPCHAIVKSVAVAQGNVFRA